MKTLKITLCLFAMLFIFFSYESCALTITKLGKGGVVVQPNGSYKLCPQFSFKKCCKITLTWKDLWKWISDGGCWEDDINSNMPLVGNAIVYDENGMQVGTYSARITWINPSSCATIDGDDIIVEHPDILVESIP